MLNNVNNLQSVVKDNNTSFKRQDNYLYASKSTTSQKCGKGVASLLVPGLGQVINGENAKGIAFCLGMICSYLALVQSRSSKFWGHLACLGIRLWSIIDAYKKG